MKKKTCFVGQIKTRIDVYKTLCPQQMLVHKGGKIKNWGGECRDVTPKNCSLKIYLKRALGVGLGSQDGCERRIKVLLFFVLFCFCFFVVVFFFWGGGGSGRGSGWGVRVDVNREVKFLLKLKKIVGGGRFGGVGLGGSGWM